MYLPKVVIALLCSISISLASATFDTIAVTGGTGTGVAAPPRESPNSKKPLPVSTRKPTAPAPAKPSPKPTSAAPPKGKQNGPAPRKTRPFTSIKGSDAAWKKLASFERVKGKRDLRHNVANKPADHTEVPTGDNRRELSNRGLWTQGLVTCMGVVIVGTADGLPYDKHMAHFYCSNLTLDAAWAKFEKEVRESNMRNMRAYLSVPNTNTETPPGWTAELKQMTNDIIELTKEKINALVGANPTVLTRFMARQQTGGAYGTMSVDKDKNVSHEGHKV